MNGQTRPPNSPWEDAVLAASLFAVDPVGTGGVSLRALSGPVRDAWLACLRDSLPSDAPLRRVPLNIADGRLLGGLDLMATLDAGRPIADRGILVEADGGVVLLAMAERVSSATAARIAAVLDTGEVALQRDGIAMVTPTHFGLVLLDEGMTEDERSPGALRDRVALAVDLCGLATRDATQVGPPREDIAAARRRLPDVSTSDALVEAVCSAALALGIASVRAPLQALRVARAAAALGGRCPLNNGLNALSTHCRH